MKRLVLCAAFFLLTGATWPLQPLVKRNAQPSGPVPPECEQGLAPSTMPRIDIAEAPPPAPPAMPAPPPSATLRGELEAAHKALALNDRPSFDLHLANVKALLADYPAGGERNEAEEIVRVLEDAARVWNAQYESPFFTQDSEAYARASRYPGYAEAVRRGILTDDAKRRLYPAAESRDFLTAVAADRLHRLGVRSTTSVVRTEGRARRTPPRTITSPTPPPRTAAATRSTTTATRNTHRRPAKAMAAKPKPAPPAAAATTTPTPTPAPAPPPAAATTTTAPAPSPAATTAPPPSATETTTTTMASTTTAPETGTVTTEAPAEQNEPSAQLPERRSVVVPALLILIGLGVLIVLFRASK